MVDVGDRVEVTDETSRLYHAIGHVVALTRAGRPVVRFGRWRRTWRHPIRGEREYVMEPDQVDLVPARV
ncbi:MAG TPA: hypothetical protein VI172_04095 [Candidatus Dormibacteraeota bacterium]|jgi:hypothetical protein